MRLLILSLGCLFYFSGCFADCNNTGNYSYIVDVKNTVGVGKFQFNRPLLNKGEYILTFDDGPHPQYTEKILDVLNKRCVKAVFFVLGEKVQKYSSVLGKVISNGHIVGSHSFLHHDLTKIDLETASLEIIESIRTIESHSLLYGERYQVKLFRFPGFKKNSDLELVVRSYNMTIVSADVSPGDWRGDSADVTFQRFLKIINNNDRGIIVLHDPQPNTVELLKMIFDEFDRRGLVFVAMEPKL